MGICLLEGTYISGGITSLKKYEDIFNIKKSGLSKRYRIDKIRAFYDGRIYVRFKIRKGGSFYLLLKPPNMDGYFIKSKNILICYEGKEINEEQKRILNTVRINLKEVTIEDLRKILLEDTGSVICEDDIMMENFISKDSGGIKGPDVYISPEQDFKTDDSIDQEWGNTEQWHQFFCDKEILRNIYQQFYIVDPVIDIIHGDLECNYATPSIDDGTMSFFNYPWIHPYSKRKDLKSQKSKHYTTDLRDIDVIKGSGVKLENLFKDIRNEIKDEKIIILNNTCVPTIVGDDLELIVDRHCKSCKVPIIHINPVSNSNVNVFEKLFSHTKNKHEFKKCIKHKDAINLIGFQKDIATQELVFILEEIGIKINVWLLPEIDLSMIEKYMFAKLQVFHPIVMQKDVYKNIFLDIPMDFIYPAPPYGIEGTKEWLFSIASKMEKETKFHKVWKQHFKLVSEQWKSASKKAKDYRLGIIVDNKKINKVVNPEFMSYIPILSLIEEMGFGIDILIYNTEKDDPQAIEPILNTLKYPEHHTILFFYTRAELVQLLREGKFSAVYSDIFFDKRLTENGKAQFSLQVFEMGLEGALRSLENLLGVCMLPFYRDYFKYLSKSKQVGFYKKG